MNQQNAITTQVALERLQALDDLSPFGDVETGEGADALFLLFRQSFDLWPIEAADRFPLLLEDLFEPVQYGIRLHPQSPSAMRCPIFCVSMLS